VPTHFADLDLLPSLQLTLAQQGLTTLTEIQARALPELLQRRSVAGIAETGSGKTLTYVLPVLDRLKRLEEAGNAVDQEGEPRAIVMVPTRELGEQVAKVFKGFTHDTRLRVRAVLGGQKVKQNRESVAGAFEVLVCTPGRLERLLASKQISLGAVRFLVLDEADQMLDLGFLPTVLEVLQACPSQRQLGLFSATLAEELRGLVRRFFADTDLIETSGAHQIVPTLRTRHVPVPDGRRFDALRLLLQEPNQGGTLLFANTHSQCDNLRDLLTEAGFQAEVLRGDMEPVERRRNLMDFRAGTLPLLVATDMSARGLDIEHVERVINVHLPRELDNYLHRVGRTARAGRSGLVINLVTPRDAPFLALLNDGSTAPEFIAPPGARVRSTR
jgi:ATP-dependent RNA helicase RhlE